MENNKSMVRGFNSLKKFGGSRDKKRGIDFFILWIKSYLHQVYCPENAYCIELSCMDDSYLPILFRKKTKFIFVANLKSSPVKEHAKEFIEIYKEQNRTDTCCMFGFGDYLKNDIFQCSLLKDYYFNFSICHLSLAHAFESEETASMTIKNLSSHLLPDSYIVITAIDAMQLVLKFRDQYSNDKSKVIGNSLYQAECLFDLNNPPMFDAKYKFQLNGITSEFPEYLIHPKVLQILAERHNLEFKSRYNFQDFYDYTLSTGNDEASALFRNLIKLNDPQLEQELMTNDEWEICSLYCFYVFRVEKSSVQIQKDDLKADMAEYKENVVSVININSDETVNISLDS